MNKSVYECKMCNRVFAGKSSFIRHVVKQHNASEYYEKYSDPLFETILVCKKCGSEHLNYSGLSKHISMSHNAEEYYLTYIDPSAGKCHNPGCNNKCTFRSILHSNKGIGFGIGFDPYCSNNCAHADPNSKFHGVKNGYNLRAMTAEHSANEILENDNYYERQAIKKLKYIPEHEWKVVKELKNRNIQFTWQKQFGKKNCDLYFPLQNVIVELNEKNHDGAGHCKKDTIRKNYILSLDECKDTTWVTIPVSNVRTDYVVQAILDVLDIV